jgi:hypothetical protein
LVIFDDVAQLDSKRVRRFSGNPAYYVHDNDPDASRTLAELDPDFSDEEEEEEEPDQADEDVFPNKPRMHGRPKDVDEEVEYSDKKNYVKSEDKNFFDKHGSKILAVGTVISFLSLIFLILNTRRKGIDIDIPMMLHDWNYQNNNRYDYLVQCITDALKQKTPQEAKNDWMQYIKTNGLENKEYETIISQGKVRLAEVGITEDWRVKRDLFGNPQQVHKLREFIR